MATNQNQQIASALKAAAKLILTGERQVTRLTTQLERTQARLEAMKEAKAAGRGVAKGPKAKPAAKGPKAKLAAEKPMRAKKLAAVEEDDDQPVRVKRGPKAAAGKVVKGAKVALKKAGKVVKAAPVAAKKAVTKGPKAKLGAGKPAMKKAAAGKLVKKSKAGNDDFLLP